MGPISISDFRVSVYSVPTKTPRESDGTLEWNSTTMVLVELKAQDRWGLGYTYGHPATATLAQSLLKSLVVGEDVYDISRIWQKMKKAIRNEGHYGISAMAIAAVDIALWDLKAKVLGVSLVKLIGVLRDKVELYGSGGFTSYSEEQLQQQLITWQKKGLKKFKIKVGANPDTDASRVQFVRKVIGPNAGLMVDANEAYRPIQALCMAYKFSEQNVIWFEQPISCEDLEGMKELKDRFPVGMALTSGEYIYNSARTLYYLNSRCVDVLQLDVTRCQGISGLLESAALCDIYNVPISTHCAPALHSAFGCAVRGLIHIESFFDHERIENEFFEGIYEIQNGCIYPDFSAVGHGLKLKANNIERYKQ
ncbi:MAG: enolase C-terminal domain-like protein [Pseudobdellovibrionaceae bacterium]